MLLWALAAMVPILLQVWRRRHARRLDWAAMDFLTRAVQQTARRLRMQHLLLLIIRVMILILLAVALAEPHLWIDSTHAAAKGRRPRHRVLVLDASYSMGLLYQGVSRFELARQQALEVVRHSDVGDAFSLVWMGLPNRSIFGRPARDPDAVAEEIERLECGDGGADLEQALQLVVQLVQQAKEADPRLEVREVLWFTDLRSNTWQPVKTDPVAQRLRELSAQATLVVVDLSAPVGVNLAVSDLRTSAHYVTVGRDITFQVTVDNLGQEPVVDTPIELLIEGRTVARRTLQSAPRGTQTVEMTYRFTGVGDQRVEVRLPQDSLPADNRRFLVVPVRAAIRACVSAVKTAPPATSRWRYSPIPPGHSRCQRPGSRPRSFAKPISCHTTPCSYATFKVWARSRRVCCGNTSDAAADWSSCWAHRLKRLPTTACWQTFPRNVGSCRPA